MNITMQELEKIMIEKGVLIRAIPMQYTEYWSIQEKYIEGCKNKVVYDEKRKMYFEEMVKTPKHGGKFIIESNCKNSTMIQFNNPIYYNSIEEAIGTLF